MKTILYIDIATFINENNKHMTSNSLRRQQIINGLQKLFTYNFKEKGCDILITDNTSLDLPDDIKQVLPENILIRCFNDNRFGSINKGTGLIQKWLYNKDILINYDFIIHFEGRLELKSHTFFDNFFDNPREIFRFGDPNDKTNHTLFFTGLFSIKSSSLFEFCNKISIKHMIHNYISIEYPIRDIFISSVDIIENLDIIWYPANGEIVYF
jgi:hypothetical protein